MKALGSEPWWFWKHHWTKRSTWGKRRLTILIVLMMGVFNAIPYTSINHLSNYLQRTAFDPEIAFDTNLAFIPWMFIPYITLYFYYPAAAFLGNKNDNMWRQNIIFHQMMTISCWFVFAAFLLFPVEIDLRGPIQDQLQDGDFWKGGHFLASLFGCLILHPFARAPLTAPCFNTPARGNTTYRGSHLVG